MNRSIVIAFCCLIGLYHGGMAKGEDARFLDNEIKGLLDQIEEALNSDIDLKGRSIKLGRFSSLEGDEKYGPELRRIFESRLANRLVASSGLTLTVDYSLFDSETVAASVGREPKDAKLLVMRLTAKIVSRTGEIVSKTFVTGEINDTTDIARVFGVTVAPPPNGSQFARNQSLKDTVKKNDDLPPGDVVPTFQQKGERIGILGNDKFFVEILVKDAPDGSPRAIRPVANAKGNAFVDLKTDQFYEIVIHNNDEFDCVAQIRIDGQDVMNRFNIDGVQYPGLLIPKQRSGLLRGWLHTVKDRSIEKDNVFCFAVKEYAHGSDNPIPATGELGVITIQFAVAWKEGESRPAGRSISRFTDKGPGLQQDFQVLRRNIGEFNETIAIRYSSPEE